MKKSTHWANQMNSINFAVCRKKKRKSRYMYKRRGNGYGNRANEFRLEKNG